MNSILDWKLREIESIVFGDHWSTYSRTTKNKSLEIEIETMFVAIIRCHETKIDWPIPILIEILSHPSRKADDLIDSIDLVNRISDELMNIVELTNSQNMTRSQFQRACEFHNYDIRILIDAIFFDNYGWTSAFQSQRFIKTTFDLPNEKCVNPLEIDCIIS